MVGITVTLSTVAGSMMLGFTEQLNEPSPQASLTYEYEGGNVTITHESGDSIAESQVEIVDSNASTDLNRTTNDGTYHAGDVIATGPFDPGEHIRVIWRASEEGFTMTLGQSRAP